MIFRAEIRIARTATLIIMCMHLGGVANAATPPTEANCTGPEPFADPESCTSFYQCFSDNGAWIIAHLVCPPGGVYDDINKSCNEGTCEDPTTTTTEPTTMTTTTEPTTTEPTTTTNPTTVEASVTTTASPDPATSTVAVTSTTPASSSSTVGSSGPTTPSPTSTMSMTSTTTLPPETTTETTTTVGPPTFTCTATGFFAHPTDPTKYYQCVLIGAQFYYYIYSCPPNACFQQSSGLCVVGSCSSTNGTVTTPPTPPPTTATTPAPTAPPPFVCSDVGFFAHPSDPTKYYQCVFIGGNYYPYLYTCPPKSCFQQSKGLCVVGTCPTPVTTTTAAPPKETTAAVATTTTPSPPFVCSAGGFFAHPTEPTNYYQCVLIGGQFYPYLYTCPPKACFQESKGLCVVGTCPTSVTTTTTTLTPPKETTAAAVTTTIPSPPFVCSAVGFFAHPTDPTKYYQCVLIGGQYYSYLHTCPPNACFQQSSGICVIGSCPPAKSRNLTSLELVGASTKSTPAPVEIMCESEKEQHPFPGSCTKYYNCILLNDGFVYYVFECPPGSYFNATTSVCTSGECPPTLETKVA